MLQNYPTMKHISLFLLVFLAFQAVVAQTAKRLHLQSTNFTLPPNGKANWRSQWVASPAFEGKKYIILQFNEIPTDAQKAEMHTLGVDLLHYLPDYAWFVSAPENLDIEKLRVYPVYAFSQIFPTFKLSQALNNKHKGKDYLNEAIALEISLFPTDNESLVIKKLEDIGGKNVQKGLFPSTYQLNITANQLAELVNLPFIYFISEAHPPIQNELTYRNTVGRANYLSSGINGMNYNGDGVTLAIEESGIIDTLSIDFQGRKKERTSGNTVGGHKTGCADNAGNAGNYDPKFRANAWGATIMSLDGSTWSYYDTANLKMASHSYGWGVSGGYWTGAQNHDQQVRLQPSMMHFYSSGNQGSDTCNYGIYNGIGGWANLTGGSKQAKNIMAINNTSPYDSLSFGSVGPAFDGRIKPDLCIEGWEGTSYSSPKAAGMMAQLYQVWKTKHAGANPQSGLIKAFMLNTADDLYTPGPDFRTGFGRINVRRAYNSINTNNFFVDSLANGATKQHTLTIPANVKEVRALLYWTDYEATPNAAKALVNDLNFTVKNPANTIFKPWTLNLFPHADSLDNPAKRGLDSLNNVEQITITNPAAGNYTLYVNGHLVPQGPQKYWIVYEFLYNELTLTYPIGKEHFVAGESEIIRWDNYGGTGTISVDFSANNGATWTNVVSNLPNGQTQYAWTVPAIMTGEAKIRVTRNALQSASILPFNIMPVPQNLHRIWSCADSFMLKWDAVSGANQYRITRLGQKYMDSVGVTTNTNFKIKNANTNEGEWLSVQAYGAQNALSRRAIAWHWLPGDTNCVPLDAAMLKVAPYQKGYYPDCYTDNKRILKATFQNNGLNTITNTALKYQLDAGPIRTVNFSGSLSSANDVTTSFTDSLPTLTVGTHILKVWVNLVGDTNHANDTLKTTIIVYPSATVNINTLQNFDAFTGCSTAWGCETEICGLSAGWFNVPNTPTILGDSIDWRTLSGATGTGGTGPDFDHTTGTTGNYLYLETSGNNGNGCQYKEAKLHSTCIDLGGTNKPTLDFWFHAYGGSIGKLNVDVLGDNGWTKNVMPEISGDHGNIWLNQLVGLDSFAGEEVVIAFRGETGGGYTGDFALDDINIYSLPSANFSVASAMCVGSLTLPNTSTNALTYTWNISPNLFAYQNGTNSHSVNPQILFNNAGTYTLQLIATNASGSDTSTQQITVQTPLTPFSITTTTMNICEGETLTLTANTSNYNGIYAWEWLTFTDTSNTSTLQIPNVPVSSAGSFTCTISNACGTMLSGININVYPKPIVSLGNNTTITTNDTLVLNSGGGFSQYQWNNLPNTNQPTYTIYGGQTGVGTFPYFVSVTDGNGCKDADTVLVTITLFIDILPSENNGSVMVYPNPNKGSFYISLSSADGQEMELQLFDITGKKIAEENYLIQKDIPHLISLKNKAKGTYLLELKWGKEVRNIKILVE